MVHIHEFVEVFLKLLVGINFIKKLIILGKYFGQKHVRSSVYKGFKLWSQVIHEIPTHAIAIEHIAADIVFDKRYRLFGIVPYDTCCLPAVKEKRDGCRY